MRYVVAVLATCMAAVTVAACAGRPAQPAPIPENHYGMYEFKEWLQDAGLIEGSVRIGSDGIVVETKGGICELDERTLQSAFLAYRCAEATLSFSRTNPAGNVRYTADARISEPWSRCVNRPPSAEGSSMSGCTWETRYSIRTEQRIGRVHLTRMGA